MVCACWEVSPGNAAVLWHWFGVVTVPVLKHWTWKLMVLLSYTLWTLALMHVQRASTACMYMYMIPCKGICPKETMEKHCRRWHCIRRELFILHTTLCTVTEVKRRYKKHCVNKMADSSRSGKFLTLLTLERSSFRENATLQATIFTRSICQDLNEPLNVPQTRKRPKKERTNKLSNKQTDSRTLYPCCACARTG